MSCKKTYWTFVKIRSLLQSKPPRSILELLLERGPLELRWVWLLLMKIYHSHMQFNLALQSSSGLLTFSIQDKAKVPKKPSFLSEYMVQTEVRAGLTAQNMPAPPPSKTQMPCCTRSPPNGAISALQTPHKAVVLQRFGGEMG